MITLPGIVNWLPIFCKIFLGILLIYFIIRTFKLVLKYHIGVDSPPVAALSIGYVIVSFSFIVVLIWNLSKIGFIQLDNASTLSSPPPIIFTYIYASSIFIFAAYISNFSRSFFFLKKLDYGEINDFYAKLNTKTKRLIEFIARLSSVIFFILFEISLSEDLSKKIFFKHIGSKGIILYISLIIWLIICKIFKIRIKELFLIFSSGLFLSFSLATYSSNSMNKINLFSEILIYVFKMKNDLTIIVISYIIPVILAGIIIYKISKEPFTFMLNKLYKIISYLIRSICLFIIKIFRIIISVLLKIKKRIFSKIKNIAEEIDIYLKKNDK